MRMRLSVVTLLWMAAVLPGLAQDCGPRPRLISVLGTAEVNVAPDEVILNLGVESRDRDLNLAKSSHDKRVKKLMAIAQEAGVEAKNIQTSSLTMGPDYSEEKVPKLLGYEVSQTVQITLKDISKYEQLMTKVLEAGVNRVSGIQFMVADPKKYREEVRAKAIHAAREKAVAMATELGQNVGKPWEISETSNASNPFYSGYGRVNANYAYSLSVPLDDSGSTVAPGQVTIRDSVNVSFQLE